MSIRDKVVSLFKPEEMQNVKGTDGQMYKLSRKTRTMYQVVRGQLRKVGTVNAAGELVPVPGWSPKPQAPAAAPPVAPAALSADVPPPASGSS